MVRAALNSQSDTCTHSLSLLQRISLGNFKVSVVFNVVFQVKAGSLLALPMAQAYILETSRPAIGSSCGIRHPASDQSRGWNDRRASAAGGARRPSAMLHTTPHLDPLPTPEVQGSSMRFNTCLHNAVFRRPQQAQGVWAQMSQESESEKGTRGRPIKTAVERRAATIQIILLPARMPAAGEILKHRVLKNICPLDR